MRRSLLIIWSVLCLGAAMLPAQDARHATYQPLPAAGQAPPADVAATLQQRIDALRQTYQQQNLTASETADVEVLLRAVELALQQNLFYSSKDIATATDLLDRARSRLELLLAGDRGIKLLQLAGEVLDKPQAVAGGFVSDIDDSVQPYGLVIPAGWSSDDGKPRRLDVWLHGRGDSHTELQFLRTRLKSTGPITPPDTFVLHPFGRHCNAFKFAGERDVYEAIAHVAQQFAIDPQRISIRGFSMGGAGCWHLAVHHPSFWFAANPGAGFADTVQYQGWDKKPAFQMTDFQKQLLNWYDCPPWAGNLSNTQVIAYSGEVDKQKLAADVMWDASQQHGIQWPYVIGAGMGHKIDPASAQQMDQQLQAWAEQEPAKVPTVDFTTYTLRYPRCHWLTIEGMQQHWQAARVQGKVEGGVIQLQTEGVTHLAIDLPAGALPAERDAITIRINGEGVAAPDAVADQSYHCDLIRVSEGWAVAGNPDRSLRKRPGLQGPIDDALTQRFVFVRPSRPCWHGQVERWATAEYEYAVERWKRVMRGEVREVLDRNLSEATIRDSNLILFGDPRANRVLAGMLNRLPLKWDRDRLEVNGQTYDASRHAAVMVFPNPLNPERYVVLNSGHTFRDFSNVSNSRQIPMLPDWAVLDVAQGANALLPGEVKAAGFFNEQWE
ncbi:prolyl oligopeptidase family serine peptidase [Roseimaritima ulvae]|uniref:prolyl oligopeptidase family serine peptidase n=1 Tax=Roseimaritima ulvae TaxID=980254 RepID=UPI000AAAD0A0|nr:prolyl oligopeptidase family serine peptidase [Roseimaritima ulvae]